MECLTHPVHVVLVADDDAEDRMLLKEALEESGLKGLRFVVNGEEVLDYLHHRGTYRVGSAPRPCLILLDLRLPKKDGVEVLQEVKSDPMLKVIPVVVVTTSDAPRDLHASYLAGANSYIVKPARFQEWIEAMATLRQYWFKAVSAPCQIEVGTSMRNA